MKLIANVCAVNFGCLKLIKKMNKEHILKVAFEGLTFRPGKYRQFSAALTVDPTMASVHLNKHHIHDFKGANPYSHYFAFISATWLS